MDASPSLHASSPKVKVTTETGERTHLPWLDAARVIAACAVVWIHTPRSESLAPSVALGRFAVPFFLGASLFLIVRAAERGSPRPLLAYIWNRTQRLLFPFAAWSVIYLLLKLVKKQMAPDQPNEMPGWEALFLGTAYHLWFLPFLWAISVVAFPLTRLCHSIGSNVIPIVVSLCLGSALAVIPVPSGLTTDESLYFMWLALPAACWAYALAWGWPWLASRFSAALRWPIAWSLWIFSTGLLWMVGRDAVAEAVSGLSFLVIALHPHPAQLGERLGALAKLAFGVYLSHLLILKVAESVMNAAHWAPSPTVDLLLLIGTIASSLTLSHLLQQSRSTRWMLG